MECEKMSETHMERARRKARQARATGVYGTGATEALRTQTHNTQEEE